MLKNELYCTLMLIFTLVSHLFQRKGVLTLEDGGGAAFGRVEGTPQVGRAWGGRWGKAGQKGVLMHTH